MTTGMRIRLALATTIIPQTIGLLTATAMFLVAALAAGVMVATLLLGLRETEWLRITLAVLALLEEAAIATIAVQEVFHLGVRMARAFDRRANDWMASL